MTTQTFLVSGGAKGITAECTIKLAKKQPGKFILLGRSEILATEPEYAQNCTEEAALKKRIMENLISQGEKPTPMSVQKIYNQIHSSREIKKTIVALQQTGSTVEYINVDVTDKIALQQKINAVVNRMGTITGIIHGAGNLADKLIEKKTAQDFEKVYTAKVQGLENLLTCINPQQLQHLVLFSSVTGFYGNMGQSDYAIANEILNKSAHLFKQNYPHCHVVAINWGGWDSGMVTPEIKKAFTERGIDIIPVEVGTQMLVQELHPRHHDTTQLVIGSPMMPPPAPLDTTLKTHRIRRRMTVENNPFLLDHVIAGHPVLPAASAMSWMINACEECYPGYRYFSCKDFKFLKGIIFNDSVATEHIIELKEISKIPGESIEFHTKILSKNSEGKTHYHFQSTIKIVRQLPPPPTYQAVNLTPDNIITDTVKELYQNGPSTLFHGPCFQGIEKVINISPEKITVECFWRDITPQQQGQFPIHWHNPYSADLSTHPLWIWLSHFHQEVCLPGQMGASEQFRLTPCNETFYVSCEIQEKKAASATANFYLHDRNGLLYSRILGSKAVVIPVDLVQPK